MATIWNDRLEVAVLDIVEIRKMLGELSEQELEVLTGFKPIISLLVSSCDFLIANINVIRKRLE